MLYEVITPIGLMIRNTDQRSKDYSTILDRFRPGHADYTYNQKYGFRDYRGGGRSSARETAMRVAAGGIAKKYLWDCCGIQVRGYLAQLGPIRLALKDWDAVEGNPFFCPEPERVPELEAYMDALRKEGNVITSYSIHYTKLYDTYCWSTRKPSRCPTVGARRFWKTRLDLQGCSKGCWRD